MEGNVKWVAYMEEVIVLLHVVLEMLGSVQRLRRPATRVLSAFDQLQKEIDSASSLGGVRFSRNNWIICPPWIFVGRFNDICFHHNKK